LRATDPDCFGAAQNAWQVKVPGKNYSGQLDETRKKRPVQLRQREKVQELLFGKN
jgi:hypothetical protein